MISILQRLQSQRQKLAQTSASQADEAMELVLAGKEPTEEQLALLSDDDVNLAERRKKELAKVSNGEAAAKDLPAAKRKVAEHREALDAAINAAKSKHNPRIIEAHRNVHQLTELESQGQRARSWLIDSTPAHVSAPLLHLRKQLVRLEQGLDHNLRLLNQAKARLQSAKEGTLPYSGALPVSSGHRGAASDKAAAREVSKNFSASVVEPLKDERRRLGAIFDDTKARVDDLRDKVAKLEALQLEPWPSHSAVAAILGQLWDPAEAAKVQLPELICTKFGTPAALR